jgi:hypothetical protein
VEIAERRVGEIGLAKQHRARLADGVEPRHQHGVRERVPGDDAAFADDRERRRQIGQSHARFVDACATGCRERDIRRAPKRVDQLLDARGRQHIVVAQELDELAARFLEAADEIAARPQPRWVALITHRALGSTGGDDRRDFGAGRIVGDDDVDAGRRDHGRRGASRSECREHVLAHLCSGRKDEQAQVGHAIAGGVREARPHRTRPRQQTQRRPSMRSTLRARDRQGPRSIMPRTFPAAMLLGWRLRGRPGSNVERGFR